MSIIKNILGLIILFSSPLTIYGQSFSIQKEKYWIYRERVKNFVIGGTSHGSGMPANSRGTDVTVGWSDAGLVLGEWIGALAMEYKLLSNTGADLTQTKQDLYYAIEAINRLDCLAEWVWGCGNYDCVPSQLNGFLIADDVPSGFANLPTVDLLNESWVPPPDSYRAKCISSSGTDYAPYIREASQDHLTGIYVGLMLVRNLIPGNETAPGAFMDGKNKYVEEVQEISQRVITWMKDHGWKYWNKCEDRCVYGVQNLHNQNSCYCTTYSVTCIDESTTSCDKGGANAFLHAIGFAKVNYEIQKGGNYAQSASFIFSTIVSGYCSIYRGYWNAALNNPIDISWIPVTLSALGNIGEVQQFPPCPSPVGYLLQESNKSVAKYLKNKGENKHWEHLILLHRLLYGNFYKSNGDLISISDDFYQCLLNAAPCRGFDGTSISGGNVEWGCHRRILGDRADQNGDCVEKVEDGNDGIPGWGYAAFNRIDYMFYFNLFNLVSPQASASSFTPVPIKEFALSDIIKDNNYVEYDKKNFMAANTITAHDYTITVSPTQEKGRVTFVAGNKITLGDNFKVTNGGYFHGYIDPTTISAMQCVSPTTNDCSSYLRIEEDDTTAMGPEFDTLFVMSDSIPDTTLRVINQNDSVSKQHIHNFFNFSIIPNPSTGIFTLMSKDALQSIEARDVLGNIMFNKHINNQPINIDIDLSSHPKGIYFIKAQSADKIYTEKVVVQ